MKYSLWCIFMYERWRTRQTNFKKRVGDIMVNSSSICYHLSVLVFFKCRLYHCFRLTSSLLCSANLKPSKPTCNTKKAKPRCLVYFSLSEHDRWKIEGEGKHSRQRRQLSNLGEQTATNLHFTAVQWRRHCGKAGRHTVAFWEEREGEWEKMAANEVGGLWSIVLTCLQ